MLDKVLAIANRKGGVGKTTLTLALALYLSRRGQRVLSIDLDSQAHTTIGLGLTLGSCLPGWLMSRDGKLEPMQVAENLLLAPGGIETEVLERGLEADKHTTLLRNKLNAMEGYDWVLMDCPPSMGMMTQMALVAAKYVLVPTQLEEWSLRAVVELTETLSEAKQKWGARGRIMGVVPNMVRSVQLHEIYRQWLVDRLDEYRPELSRYGSVWPSLKQTIQIPSKSNPWEYLTAEFREQWEKVCGYVLHYEEQWRKQRARST